MTTALQAKEPFDLELASKNFLLGVMFTKSSSKTYPLAVNIAKGAARYVEDNTDGNISHLVLFDKTREDAIRAKALLSYAKTWRSTQVFAGGKGIANAYRVLSVLECYTTAAACKDHRAHCYVTVSENTVYPVDAKEEPLTFPCRFIYGFVDREIRENQKTSIQDQYEAMAIRRGCDFCPYFKAELLTKVPRKKSEEQGGIRFETLFG